MLMNSRLKRLQIQLSNHRSLLMKAAQLIAQLKYLILNGTRRLHGRHIGDHSWMQQQIIEHSPDGLILVDALQPDMPIIYANPAFERLTGYSCAEVIGQNSRFLHGQDRDQAGLQTLRAAIRNRETCVVTLRNYRKDGSLFWNELHITPIHDPHGRVTHFTGAQKDITQRKTAEMALEQSNLRYHQMFDSNSAVNLVVDPVTGSILDVNVAAEKFYGYSRQQLMAMRVYDLNPAAEGQIKQALQAAAFRERSYFEFRHRLASGELRDVNVYASPVDTPQGRVLYAIVVEVTQKRLVDLRYRALFEQSNDAVFILDLQGRHIQVNQRAADLFGYTVEELNQLSYRELVFPADLEDSWTTFQRLIAGEHIPPYECNLRHNDGHAVSAEINIEVVHDANGKPLHFQSILRDISERLRLETALRDQYLELDGFFSVALDLLCIADMQGRFLKVNKAWETTLGFPVKELENRLFFDFVHPDDIAATREALAQLEQQSNVLNFTNRYRCQDGSYRYIEWRSHPAGNILYAAARDITERKRMEESLRESEEKYRWLAENISDGILIYDAVQSKITYASATYDSQNGRPIGTSLGMDLDTIRDKIHAEDRAAVFQTIVDAIVSQRTTATYTYRAKHTAGHYAWHEDHAGLHYAPDGTLLTIHITSRDITQRKQAQQQEFDLLLEKERTRLLTRFVQDAAHEFRTPLSIITTSSYLLSRLDDPQQRILKADQIGVEVNHITELVDMLLLMAKLESTEALRHSPIDINGLLEAEAQRIASSYPHPPRLELKLADKPLSALGDATYLAHACYQLLDNAFRFTPSDGRVAVTVIYTENQVCVEISDTGIGIPEDDLPHIFEIFWRRDEAHSTPGLGLGLPIARRIIEHHGGQINVTSAVGQGSRFCFTLPAAASGD